MYVYFNLTSVYNITYFNEYLLERVVCASTDLTGLARWTYWWIFVGWCRWRRSWMNGMTDGPLCSTTRRDSAGSNSCWFPTPCRFAGGGRGGMGALSFLCLQLVAFRRTKSNIESWSKSVVGQSPKKTA